MTSASVVSGVRWTGLGQGAQQLVKAAISIALARLLTPEDFGLVAMANVFIGFLLIFEFMGFQTAIVQRKELSNGLVRSLATLGLFMGVVMTVLCYAIAPLVAQAYREPRVESMLQILGVTFFISAWGLVPSGLLTREMLFRSLVQVQLAAAVVDGAISITLAFMGWGAWALVAGSIAGAVVRNGLLLIVSPRRFRLGFQWSEVKSVFGYSMNIVGFNVVGYASGNADRLIIGRALGSVPLGYYSVAHRLYLRPLLAIMRMTTRVLLPTLSRLQGDEARMRAAFLRANAAIALLTYPMMAGMAALAGPLVVTVLGQKWEPAVPLLTIMAFVGMLQTVSLLAQQMFLAKGRSDWLLGWGILSSVAYIGSFLVGIPYGLVGMVAAYAAANVIVTFAAVVLVNRLASLTIGAMLRNLWPYIESAGVMAAVVLACRFGLERAGAGPATVVAVCVPLGVAVYTVYVFLRDVPALSDALRLLPSAAQRRLRQFMRSRPEAPGATH